MAGRIPDVPSLSSLQLCPKRLALALVEIRGFSLLLPHNCLCLCSRLEMPLEMPAGVVVFHCIAVALKFSRHLSCCPCLLF